MTSVASSLDTHTFYVERDFFGLAGASLFRMLESGTRNERRKAFRQLTELCVSIGMVKRKQDILFITTGSDHVGKQMLLFTCRAPWEETHG